jgi:hypothetical protein
MKDKYFKLKVNAWWIANVVANGERGGKFCEGVRLPLPCVAVDALPYFSLAESV